VSSRSVSYETGRGDVVQTGLKWPQVHERHQPLDAGQRRDLSPREVFVSTLPASRTRRERGVWCLRSPSLWFFVTAAMGGSDLTQFLLLPALSFFPPCLRTSLAQSSLRKAGAREPHPACQIWGTLCGCLGLGLGIKSGFPMVD
jgi:hypothetical protein